MAMENQEVVEMTLADASSTASDDDQPVANSASHHLQAIL